MLCWLVCANLKLSFIFQLPEIYWLVPKNYIGLNYNPPSPPVSVNGLLATQRETMSCYLLGQG